MTDNARDFEYTIVMDANYEGAVTETPNRTVERAKPAAQAPGRSSSTAPDKAAEPAEPATGAGFAREAERVYAAYEKMCLKEPTVLDKDDIYPRTYQWRAGDRYDPDKVAVVAAAVKQHRRITETEAYARYVDEVTKRKFNPISWD